MAEVAQSVRSMGEVHPAARLGGELRAARQRLGWELPELAASLRIRQVYLEAIEAGRMGDLPGMTYALGFVRTYASALGLPGEEVAQRFRDEAEEVRQKPALSFPAPVPQRGVPAGALMLLGLVILCGAYGGWYYVSERQHTPMQTVPPIPERMLPQAQQAPTPSPQVATILPSASPPSANPPAPAAVAPAPGPGQAAPAVPKVVGQASVATPGSGPGVLAAIPGTTATVPAPVAPSVAPAAALGQQAVAANPAAVPPGTRIVLKTSADAWVTIKQKSGPALFNKLMHAGDSFPVPGDKPGLTLTTGNAGGTEVDVDGAAVAGIGASGMVRRDLPLDADLLKSGHLPPIVRSKPKPAHLPAPEADQPADNAADTGTTGSH